jgi:Fe-S cluster assembly scaffold protein SufB
MPSQPLRVIIGQWAHVKIFETQPNVCYQLQANASILHANALYAQQLRFDLASNAHLQHASGIRLLANTQSNVVIHLNEPNASVEWNEDVHFTNEANYQLHLTIEHHAPQTHSKCCLKSALEAHGCLRFFCNLIAHENATHATLHQRNFNIITHPQAHVLALPQLHIFNKTVQATHGTATQTIPSEALLYLQMRGLSPEDAKRLWLEGFLQEMLQSIDNGCVD